MTYSWDNEECCPRYRASFIISVSNIFSFLFFFFFFFPQFAEEIGLHLHPGAGASVAGIVGPDHVAPLLSGLDVLSVGARIGPSRGILGSRGSLDEEAAVRNARVDGPRLENIGVGAHQHVGHHGPRASSDGENTVGISAILVDRVLDHVGNGLAVTAAIVRQAYVSKKSQL